MSSKRFKWIDRDHAAHDLIQLAHHAPPSISRQALQLLQAIQSPAVIPDLELIVQDEERDMWERKYALRVITKTPGSYYLPFLALYMEQTLAHWIKQIESHPHANIEEMYFGLDLLDEIVEFVDRNSANQDWFLAVLDRISEPKALKQFLVGHIDFELTPDFQHQLTTRLLTLLDRHLDFMTLATVTVLTRIDQDDVWLWLNSKLDTIAALCLQNPIDDVFYIVENWSELKHKLLLQNVNFEAHFRSYQQEMEESWAKRWDNRPSDFQTSPVYHYLQKLFQEAFQGKEKHYHRLISISRGWKVNIPVRAVATHFLGKLQSKYEVMPFLIHLLKYADDDWDNEISPYSPIRIEAGEALLNSVTPQVWEAMIDAFFIKPRNDLEVFFIDWIAHLTNRLSGSDEAYNGITWGVLDHRKWFHALSKISKDEFKREFSD